MGDDAPGDASWRKRQEALLAHVPLAKNRETGIAPDGVGEAEAPAGEGVRAFPLPLPFPSRVPLTLPLEGDLEAELPRSWR